jgi:type II secretion system protein G
MMQADIAQGQCVARRKMARTANSKAARGKRRGFTLIEMLVVVVIISILSALVLAAVSAARTRSKAMASKATITGLEAALERYEGDFGDYPASDADNTGIAGAENLYECLMTTQKSGPYINKSGDFPSCDPGNKDKPKFCDAWNRPIRYFHHHDYGNKAPNKHSFRMISDGPNGEFEHGDMGSDDIVNWNKEKPE